MDTIIAIMIIVVAMAYLFKKRNDGKNGGKRFSAGLCSGCGCASCGYRSASENGVSFLQKQKRFR